MILELFIAFLQIGLFSIGGGYASLAYLNEIVVAQKGWLTQSDFTDLITLSQMTPGPLAINSATFVGTKMAGLPGAFFATLGFVLPAFIIVLILSFIYYKYKSLSGLQLVMASMRIAVIGLIASVAINLFQTMIEKDALLRIILLSISVGVIRLTKINPLIVIVLIGIIYLGVKLVF